MKKRFVVLFLAIALCLSLCFCVCATESDTIETDAELSELVSEKEDGTTKYFQVYILAGSVIGAMVIVTLLYKKKDEIRYL